MRIPRKRLDLITTAFVAKLQKLEGAGVNLMSDTQPVRQPTQREWRRPELRKLPIATTAASGKAIIAGNDGSGGGKGDVSVIHS